MKSHHYLFGMLAFALVVCSGTVLAERPDSPGGGNGGGNGGGDQDKGELFGDLLIIDRDVDGVPILTDGHPQPIVLFSSVPEECDTTGLPVIDDPSSLYYQDAWSILLIDGEIHADYIDCATEVEFGRLSVARAPYDVREQALADAEATLANGEIGLDPAGRLTVTSYDPDLGEDVVKTIDSSLSNLAIYEELLEEGNLAVDVVSSLPGGFLDRAAAALGGAADKEGKVTVDVVVYLNAFMQVPEDANPAAVPLPLVAGDTRYYNFRDFAYTRSVTYGGDLCYLAVVLDEDGLPVPGGEEDQYLVEVVNGPIMAAVFDDESYTGDNVIAFAQAADDARAVIEFMHSHVVPQELAFACE
jgi:hypothetical protein